MGESTVIDQVMKGLSKIAVITGAVSIVQGTAPSLPSAFAAPSAMSGQKPIADSIAFAVKPAARSPIEENCSVPSAHTATKIFEKPLIRLIQSSDNPTIPGEGTPQRSQGSGTR